MQAAPRIVRIRCILDSYFAILTPTIVVTMKYPNMIPITIAIKQHKHIHIVLYRLGPRISFNVFNGLKIS